MFYLYILEIILDDFNKKQTLVLQSSSKDTILC